MKAGAVHFSTRPNHGSARLPVIRKIKPSRKVSSVHTNPCVDGAHSGLGWGVSTISPNWSKYPFCNLFRFFLHHTMRMNSFTENESTLRADHRISDSCDLFLSDHVSHNARDQCEHTGNDRLPVVEQLPKAGVIGRRHLASIGWVERSGPIPVNLNVQSGACRDLCWRSRRAMENVPGAALATARCTLWGWARMTGQILVERITIAIFRLVGFC